MTYSGVSSEHGLFACSIRSSEGYEMQPTTAGVLWLHIYIYLHEHYTQADCALVYTHSMLNKIISRDNRQNTENCVNVLSALHRHSHTHTRLHESGVCEAYSCFIFSLFQFHYVSHVVFACIRVFLCLCLCHLPRVCGCVYRRRPKYSFRESILTDLLMDVIWLRYVV